MAGAVPAALGAVLSPTDGEILNSIKSLNVDRYQIKSDTEGEPRSLRFTFTFAENDFFSDTTVVKDFEYKAFGDGPGGYVSTPHNFQWKKQGKRKGLNTFLDLAQQLYQAEQSFASSGTGPIDQKEREGLWQYEKLREALEKEEAQEPENDGHSFLEWFGYRGAVNTESSSKAKNGDADSESEDDDFDNDDDDEEDGMLDVEIFPSGEDVAVAIAEDLWPNVMDYFIQATSDEPEMDSDIEEDDDDEDAPQLVNVDDLDGPEDDPRPAKKRKTAS